MVKPLDGADFSLVDIGRDEKPVCKVHGAMNRVSSYYWRCLADCRAGCREQEQRPFKKVLYITDDYDTGVFLDNKKFFENDVEDWNDRDPYENRLFRFEIDMHGRMSDALEVARRKDYDLVIIDYGLIGKHEKIVKSLWDKYNIAMGGAIAMTASKELKKLIPEIDRVSYIPFGSDFLWHLKMHFEKFE